MRGGYVAIVLSPPRAEPGRPLQVGVLGFGAIGRSVVEALHLGRVEGARLAGVVTRTPGTAPRQLADTAALVGASDLIVEAAGHQAMRDHAVEILSSGTDLLTVSSGALADTDLHERVQGAGPGRLWICPGAVGGLDVIRAVRQTRQPFAVRLTSTKAPAAFVGAPLDPAVRARLDGLSGTDELVVFRGRAQAAASRFPANANVAATLALAAGDWDQVEVVLTARAGQVATHHQIDVDSVVGTYRISLANQPTPGHPASSALVAFALLRCLADRAGGGAIGFI